MKYEEIDPKTQIDIDFGPDNPNFQGQPHWNHRPIEMTMASLHDRLAQQGHLFRGNEVLRWMLGCERLQEGATRSVGSVTANRSTRMLWTVISTPQTPVITTQLKPDELRLLNKI